MKKFRDYIKEAAPTKEKLTCHDGMRYDKKLNACVPLISKSKTTGRWWGVGRHHHQTTNGNGNGNGSDNGNGNGNGHSGNGNGGSGNGGGGNGGGNGG